MQGFLLKTLSDISPVSTSHGIGQKQVLLSKEETDSCVTQIAKSSLKSGEKVEDHVHQTMDEHYLSLDGKGYLFVNDQQLVFEPGTYVLVKAGNRHHLEAESDISFLTIGIAV